MPAIKNRSAVHIFFIVVLGFIAYSNTFDVPFTFDDDANIVDNYMIRDFSNIPFLFAGLKGPFASRPFMHATFAVNYHFGGLDPEGYHAVNIVIHLLNAVLLYLLVSMTGRHLGYDEKDVLGAAVLSSLVFVLHPIQTEAVTNTVNRSMLLATTFYLTGLLLFLKAVTSERQQALYVACLFMVSLLGMGSRENFATFPLMLILYDMFFISKFSFRQAARNYKAYLPVLLSLAYMTHLAINNTYGKSSIPGGIPPPEYAMTALNVHWTYVRLLLFPVNQTLDYDYPVAQTLFEFRTLIGFLGYLSLWAGAVLMARKRPVASFLVLWFLIILLPIAFGVTFLDLRLEDVIFEHRLYLPGTGLLVLTCISLLALTNKLKRRWNIVGQIRFSAFLAIMIVLASGAYARNGVWKNEISLWQDVVQKSPQKARPHNNLGYAYYQNIQADNAIEQYEIAIKLDPNYTLPYNNLGAVYEARGLTDKRIEAYRAALRINPEFAQAHINIGRAYLDKGHLDKAMYHLDTAIKFKPYNAQAHSAISKVYEKKGLTEMAERHRRLAERGR
jgi:tetratricopeptide (TPR) repeat protein